VTTTGPKPALRTLAQTLRQQGKYRDEAARAYFAGYVAPYYEWLAQQAEVTTEADALVALVGAVVDNPAMRRALAAAMPQIQRLILVVEAAERAGQGLRPPSRQLRAYEDGSVGFDGEAAAPPAPPAAPPPPGPSATSSSSAEPPAPPKPPPTRDEVLELGRQAHDAGELLTDCPYPAGDLADAWEQGWKRAKQAARDAKRYGNAPPAVDASAKPPSKSKPSSRKKPSAENAARPTQP
jgi:hypothetical protein